MGNAMIGRRGADAVPGPLSVESDPSDPRDPQHAEWLIDEASEESFPASDASSPAMPHARQVERPSPK